MDYTAAQKTLATYYQENLGLTCINEMSSYFKGMLDIETDTSEIAAQIAMQVAENTLDISMDSIYHEKTTWIKILDKYIPSEEIFRIANAIGERVYSKEVLSIYFGEDVESVLV